LTSLDTPDVIEQPSESSYSDEIAELEERLPNRLMKDLNKSAEVDPDLGTNFEEATDADYPPFLNHRLQSDLVKFLSDRGIPIQNQVFEQLDSDTDFDPEVEKNIPFDEIYHHEIIKHLPSGEHVVSSIDVHEKMVPVDADNDVFNVSVKIEASNGLLVPTLPEDTV